ncbi:MAG: hypothetical protein JSS81_09470 [Acidobacteria bacterium]|nr:hypothetical protein [Acidobacteriota bacterium]
MFLVCFVDRKTAARRADDSDSIENAFLGRLAVSVDYRAEQLRSSSRIFSLMVRSILDPNFQTKMLTLNRPEFDVRTERRHLGRQCFCKTQTAFHFHEDNREMERLTPFARRWQPGRLRSVPKSLFGVEDGAVAGGAAGRFDAAAGAFHRVEHGRGGRRRGIFGRRIFRFFRFFGHFRLLLRSLNCLQIRSLVFDLRSLIFFLQSQRSKTKDQRPKVKDQIP